MIKRNGQPREGVTPPSLKRMSDTEHAAYFEAFGAIKGDYQALCLIGDKLREVEASARGLGLLILKLRVGMRSCPTRLATEVHGRFALR
jgi:hypothetical protein